MRRVQVFPRGVYRLFDALVAEEARLAREQRGTFHRRGRKRKDSAQWFHVKHAGRLLLKRGEGEAVEIKVRAKPGSEWQLLSALVGFLDRVFGPKVRAIHIE
jgi:hypothetical protein